MHLRSFVLRTNACMPVAAKGRNPQVEQAVLTKLLRRFESPNRPNATTRSTVELHGPKLTVLGFEPRTSPLALDVSPALRGIQAGVEGIEPSFPSFTPESCQYVLQSSDGPKPTKRPTSFQTPILQLSSRFKSAAEGVGIEPTGTSSLFNGTAGFPNRCDCTTVRIPSIESPNRESCNFPLFKSSARPLSVNPFRDRLESNQLMFVSLQLRGIHSEVRELHPLASAYEAVVGTVPPPTDRKFSKNQKGLVAPNESYIATSSLTRFNRAGFSDREATAASNGVM